MTSIQNTYTYTTTPQRKKFERKNLRLCGKESLKLKRGKDLCKKMYRKCGGRRLHRLQRTFGEIRIFPRKFTVFAEENLSFPAQSSPCASLRKVGPTASLGWNLVWNLDKKRRRLGTRRNYDIWANWPETRRRMDANSSRTSQVDLDLLDLCI